MARMSFRSPVLPLALLAASLARPAVAFADQQDPKGDARLTLVAEDGAILEVGDDSPEGWTEVCRAPCEVAVSSRRTYRVRLGDRVTELRVSPGAHTRVHLSPRSPARTVAGAALVSVGVLLVGLGGYVALRFNRSSDAEDFQAGPFVAGLAVLGGGAVLGGALLLRQPQRWVSESSVMTVRLAPTLWLTPQGLLFLPRPDRAGPPPRDRRGETARRRANGDEGMRLPLSCAPSSRLRSQGVGSSRT